MEARRAFSRRFRVAVALGAALGGAALAFACGPGAISDLTSGRLRADAGAVDACPGRAVAPLAPPGATPDGVSLDPIIFAVDDLRSDTAKVEAALPPPKGLDLDRTCNDVEPPSCVRPANARPLAAQPDGRDNVCGPLLADLAALVPVFESGYLKRRIAYGLYTLLIEVREWNGTENDPHVLVSFWVSTGLNNPDDAGIGLPKFDGNDVWDVDPASVVDGQTRIGQRCSESLCFGNVDRTAYVSGGTLVAHFESIPFVLNTGSNDLKLPFNGATLTAQITKKAKGYRIDGELAGRMPATALLSAGGSGVPDPTTGNSLCKSAAAYAAFKSNVCGAVDLAATPVADRTGAPCGALSEALAFTGGPAKIGVIRAVSHELGDCPDFTDSCTTP